MKDFNKVQSAVSKSTLNRQKRISLKKSHTLSKDKKHETEKAHRRAVYKKNDGTESHERKKKHEKNFKT